MQCDENGCKLVKKSESTKPLPRPKDDEITMYGTSWCPFCDKAKKLLEDNDFVYTYHDVEQYNCVEMFKKLTPDHKTVPKIFLGTEFIGGCKELEEILD